MVVKKKLGVLEAWGADIGTRVPRMALEQEVLRAMAVDVGLSHRQRNNAYSFVVFEVMVVCYWEWKWDSFYNGGVRRVCGIWNHAC